MLNATRHLVEPTTVHTLDRCHALVAREALERRHLRAAVGCDEQLEDLVASRSHALAHCLQAEDEPLISRNLGCWGAWGIGTAPVAARRIAPGPIASWIAASWIAAGRIASGTVATNRVASGTIAAR
jgi:hypothetical protein